MHKLSIKTVLFCLVALLLAPAASADTYDKHTLAAVTVTGPEQVAQLYECRVDIVGRRGPVYKVLFTEAELDAFTAKGFDIEVLYGEMAEDRRLWAEADAAARAAEASGATSAGRAPSFYYTASKFDTANPGSATLMKHLLDLHNAYPTLTRLYDIGDSFSGTYDILAITVPKNPDLVEAEPKIRIYANIHGDEKGGLMVACEALDWILANYATNAQAQKLVDESEMWFVPMGNPEGNASSSRGNDNGVDLNRNFWGPAGNDEGAPFSEPETQAIRDLTAVLGKRFATGLSFHGGEVCFNSLWNYDFPAPADEPIFWSARTPGTGCSNENGCLTLAADGLAKAYQDGCTTSGFWYTNGADWYQTLGDTNDWSYSVWSTLDTTLEATMTKTPATSQIPAFCAEHRPAVINYLLKTFQGIHGVMTDGDTGLPLDGTVEMTATASSTVPVPHVYKEVYTDPVAGDFHHTLLPGTYTVTCKAAGYADTVLTGVVVTADAKSTCNCPMAGTTSLHAAATSFADTCSGAGSGGDGVLDPGESAAVSVTLANAGGRAATGVTATLSTSASEVTVLDGEASFSDVPGLGTGASLAPHFTVRVSPSIACGTAIPFALHVESDQGSWDDTLSLTVGQVSPGGGNLFAQSFDATAFPPAGWAQVDTNNTIGNWARATGTVHPSGAAPHSGAGLAYFNSYSASSGSSTRLYRILPLALPAAATSATFAFWMYHETQDSSNDRVQVQVSTDGTTWVNAGSAVPRNDGSTGWKQHTVSLSGYAGQSLSLGLQGLSAYGNDIHIDDLSFDYTAPGSCASNLCTAAAGPRPVPDGRLGGAAMTATRAAADGSQILVTYDTSTCAVPDHSLLYGDLANVSAMTLAGSVCSIGDTSPYGWTAVPTGYNVFWVIVGDGGATESSWGERYDGAAYSPRSTSPSGLCGNGALDTAGTCP